VNLHFHSLYGIAAVLPVTDYCPYTSQWLQQSVVSDCWIVTGQALSTCHNMLENLHLPSQKMTNLKFFCKVEHHLFAVTAVDDIISDKSLGCSAITQK